MQDSFKVPVEKLRWRCDLDELDAQSPKEIQSFPTILGQERAVRALQVGLDMEFPGYNIYVSGPAGTGRTTTVRYLLKKRNTREKPSPDICYVNNFKNTDRPVALYFPAGKGRQFRDDMEKLIEHLRTAIPMIFESERYREQRDALLEKLNSQQQKLWQEFEAKARKQNFALVQIQIGPYSKPDVMPVIDNQPVPFDNLVQLVQEGKVKEKTLQELQKKYLELSKELEKVFKENQKLQREKKYRVAELDQDMIKPLIEEEINEIREKYDDKKVLEYLDAVEKSLLKNLRLFRRKPERNNDNGKKEKGDGVDPFLEYRVNVVVDNSDAKGAPVIFETAPSFSKLFGTIERVMDANGQWRTDFTQIRAGSLLSANGGFLVLYAMDVLLEPGVWNNLKRVLKNRQIEIQAFDPYFLIAASAIKPEPIEIDVKVIMIGDAYLYRMLYGADEDFKKIFKIKADFDDEMKNERDNLLQYASFVKKLCEEENLLPFDKTGIGAVTEFGVRMAGRQNKLSTRFNHIADLVRESSYLAGKKKAKKVGAEFVEMAIQESIERLNLIEDKIQEMIAEGTIMIDTDGEVVGQVNGLSVLSLGDYSFGRPSRITAQVSVGRSGIINIEREAELSGPTHNKGVLILSGYLRGNFAQDKPLTVSASLCFEQSYSGVDGDSASSAEIYALLSRLANVPIRQGIAVTGSVNQFGHIQPIGGVNEKIEGFYYVCKSKGLTGEQGVMIPRQNVNDLMLKNEIVEQVQKGKFHIYAIDTIEQGIEILTGMKAGEKDSDGRYPDDSIYGRVDAKLKQFSEYMRAYSATGKSQ